MKNYSFAKMNGAGNDFIIIDKSDNRKFNPAEKSLIKLCDRRRGIGADGLMLYSSSEAGQFDLEFFNADGKPGSLCGNGARCALFFHAQRIGAIGIEVRFTFNGAVYRGVAKSSERITFYMNPVKGISKNLMLQTGGYSMTAAFTDTGSPHVVVFMEDIFDSGSHQTIASSIEELPVEEIGKNIRFLKEFAPGGTNVNFVEQSEAGIKIRTFERGVEGETLACGTGSVAAAIVLCESGKAKAPVTLETRGGDKLTVDFIKNSQNEFENITLTGPAEINFTGEIDRDYYLI